MASKPSSELSAALDVFVSSSAPDIDQVENLIKFCPTKIILVTRKCLESVNRFFMELMKVPCIEAKLRVFGFKITFDSQVEDLTSWLNTIKVKELAKLRQIMQTILTGSVVGFKLDSLLKLSDTRAKNNKMTFMHYLCKLVGEKMAELLDFANDLAHLESASNIELKTLAKEMQAATKGLEKVMQELMVSENGGAISLGFRKVLKDFLDTAEEEVWSLASLYTEVILCLTTFEQVTKILTLFMKAFIKSREENEKHAEAETKKLEKEAMKGKSATKKDGPDNDNEPNHQIHRQHEYEHEQTSVFNRRPNVLRSKKAYFIELNVSHTKQKQRSVRDLRQVDNFYDVLMEV